MSGPMAEVRAGAGDRELRPSAMLEAHEAARGGGRGAAYNRSYRPAQPGERDYIDDLAWYEGRYPDDAGGQGARAGGGGGGGARARGARNARSFLPSADEP
jgi:hypothetical protein